MVDIQICLRGDSVRDFYTDRIAELFNKKKTLFRRLWVA